MKVSGRPDLRQEKEIRIRLLIDVLTGVSEPVSKDTRASVPPRFSPEASRVTTGKYFKWTLYKLVVFNLQIETH